MYLPSPHACIDTQTHTHILPLGFKCLYDTHITTELLQSLALPTSEGLCFFCSIIYGLLSSRKLCHFIISPGIKPLTMGRHRKYQDNTWCTVSFFFFPFGSLPFINHRWQRSCSQSTEREWQRKMGLRELFILKPWIPFSGIIFFSLI